MGLGRKMAEITPKRGSKNPRTLGETCFTLPPEPPFEHIIHNNSCLDNDIFMKFYHNEGGCKRNNLTKFGG